MNRCALAVVSALALLPSASALAGFSEMGQRFPTDINALVAINFEALMQSPMGQKQDWQARWTDLYEAGPLTVPPGTLRVLSGSHVLHDLESAKWQISVMETKEPLSMQEIARNMGGTSEKLWNKAAVVAPGSLYFVELEPKQLAVVAGGDRQFTVKWVREEKSTAPDSAFIRRTLSSLNAGSHIVLALDVQDQFSAAEIRQAIEVNPYKATGDRKVDVGVLSEVLASTQNVLMQIQVGESAKAQVEVQFGLDESLMEFYAKPLMAEILSRNGFALPDIKDWTVKVGAKRVTLSGELSRNSLRNILGFITGPLPAQGAGGGGQASEDPAVVAKASQAYYRAISSILDSYAGQADYSEASGWLRREGQRIDRLSILNVDPALATWGASTAVSMREAAAMFKGDQMSGIAAAQGVHSSQASGVTYGGDYYGGYGSYNRNSAGAGAVAYQDTLRERSRVMTEKKAESIKKAAAIMSGLMTERAKLRVELTKRYGVPF